MFPITPDEIAADVVACAKAGAAIAHLHVRDENGKNSMSTEIFTEVVNKVRRAVADAELDVVLNLTTSGSAFSEELRLAHLPILLPEMYSYDPGSTNWANSYVFLNTPKFLEKLGTECTRLEIKPEIEIFDAGMIGNVEYYLKKGFLKLPLHYQFVLDVPGGMPGNLESLAYLLPKLPQGSTWSITGIGKSHVPMMPAGLSAGCDGLRVGLEDDIFMEKAFMRPMSSSSSAPCATARWSAAKSPPRKKRVRSWGSKNISEPQCLKTSFTKEVHLESRQSKRRQRL